MLTTTVGILRRDIIDGKAISEITESAVWLGPGSRGSALVALVQPVMIGPWFRVVLISLSLLAKCCGSYLDSSVQVTSCIAVCSSEQQSLSVLVKAVQCESATSQSVVVMHSDNFCLATPGSAAVVSHSACAPAHTRV